MAKRCSKGSVWISRRLALRLLDWHSSSGDPVYAVGAWAMDRGACQPLSIESSMALSAVQSSCWAHLQASIIALSKAR
jgi:hypothetical protein